MSSHLSDLLDQTFDMLSRFVVFANTEQSRAIALWVAHTHAIEAADTTPYLHVNSPEKRSGKSRLLDVLDLLVARSWRTVTPSEAVTFRKIDRDAPTLLLDEIDAVFKKGANEHEGLRAILNAGFQRRTMVSRCAGPKNTDLVDFAVFGAKALAGIGGLPDTIEDRSIPISLKRRRRDQPVERFRRRDVEEEAGILYDGFEQWAEDEAVIDALRGARPSMPDQINDRAQDAWEALIAIADLAGGRWADGARQAAIRLSGDQDEDTDTTGVRLLRDCRTVIGVADRIETSDLLAGLHGLSEAPWSEWYGKPLTPMRMAKILRPYAIHSGDLRTPDGTKKGYMRPAFEDAWERYLPENRSSSRDTRDKP